MNPLVALSELGQSPWLDDLRRDLIRGGELERMIAEEGLRGQTSNPSIFEKAIGETEDYAEDMRELLDAGQLDDMAIYENLAIADIRSACDVFRPVYDGTARQDGFVSLEVPPSFAMKTQETIAEAVRLWKAVGRENLMVKVPGTPPGVPAVRALIGQGININVTLLFSISAYEAVVEAHIAGLEDLARAGGDLAAVGSVASFFLSRIDAVIDQRLDALGGDRRAEGTKLKGKVAIAWAKLAYLRWKDLYAGPRWDALAAKGARPQRLLWASTSTKDPSLPPTYYVDALIGRETVNTMPTATMRAFADGGTARRHTIEVDVAGARATIDALPSLGISLADVTEELVADGVRKFDDAFDKLLAGVARKRRELGARRAAE